jgi:hypothetical protein
LLFKTSVLGVIFGAHESPDGNMVVSGSKVLEFYQKHMPCEIPDYGGSELQSQLSLEATICDIFRLCVPSKSFSPFLHSFSEAGEGEEKNREEHNAVALEARRLAFSRYCQGVTIHVSSLATLTGSDDFNMLLSVSLI